MAAIIFLESSMVKSAVRRICFLNVIIAAADFFDEAFLFFLGLFFPVGVDVEGGFFVCHVYKSRLGG